MPEIISRVIDCHVFIIKDGEPLYLLLKRSPDVIYAGSWRMVGGKINPGEKAYETAIRELAEETELKPLRMWSVPYINSFYEAVKDRVNIIPVFAVEADSDHVRLSKEHSEYRWVSYAEAAEQLTWPAQIEGLRIVHEYIVKQKTVSGFVEITHSP